MEDMIERVLIDKLLGIHVNEHLLWNPRKENLCC